METEPIRVRLIEYNKADARLEHLKGLTNVRTVNFWGTQVTDEDVKNRQQAFLNCMLFH